jgi:anaerobic ribonucleoside-triphosphate reductase
MTTEIAIGIAGLAIAWLAYQRTIRDKAKEEKQREKELEDEKNALLVKFRLTQTIAKQVRDGLTEYATVNDAWDKEIFPGSSYRDYINTMTESHKVCLSDELYEKTRKEIYTKAEIQLLANEIEPQYRALSEMKNGFLAYIRPQ